MIEGMRELAVDANGLCFRCLADGPDDGPLALLLHGFPEGAESWSGQLPALGAAGWLAVAPDLRGYGGTDCPAGEESYELPRLVDDVVGLVTALGHQDCHLVGHDWGALVGWAVAGRRPERVLTWSALSVGHPLAFAGAIREDEDQARRSSYMEFFMQRGRAEEVLLADGARRLRAMYRLGPAPDAVPEEHVETWVEGQSRPGRLTAALSYYRANLGERAERAFPPGERPVGVPAQLIWGDQDPAVGPVGTRLTERHVAAEYRLRVLEGAGHWLPMERPAEVTALLLEWFTGHVV
jgi:pimeloyl-ACP methyl ester carboxylesterase